VRRQDYQLRNYWLPGLEVSGVFEAQAAPAGLWIVGIDQYVNSLRQRRGSPAKSLIAGHYRQLKTTIGQLFAAVTLTALHPNVVGRSEFLFRQ
jgi:hypothetical protein